MKQLQYAELNEILRAYGFSELKLDRYLSVEPDRDIYLFRDAAGQQYALIVADYFGDMSNLEIPYHVWYDYFDPPYAKIDFQATKFYSYLDGAPVAAKGYIDDDHYWTKTSAGDLCMFCQVADLKILSD